MVEHFVIRFFHPLFEIAPCERARKIRSYKRPGCHLDELSILRYNPEVVELKHD